MTDIAEYNKQLKISAKLAKSYEDLVKQRAMNETYNIEPVPQFRSLADEEADTQFQINTALQNLRGIMLPDEASTVVDRLSKTDIYELNSNIERIKKELYGRKNISANFFLQFFQRFKDFLDATGDTGLSIPVSADDITDIVKDEVSKIKPVEKKSKSVKIGKTKGSQATPEQQRLRQFEQEYPSLYANTIGVDAETAKEYYQELNDKNFLDLISLPTARNLVKAVDSNNKIRSNAVKMEVLSRVFGGQSSGRGIFTKKNKKSKDLPLSKTYDKKPKLRMSGCGLGAEQDKDTTPRFAKFGRYYVSLHSLKTKNYMTFRYPSLSHNHSVESRRVSSDFVDMFCDLLESGLLDKHKFNQLSDDEQEYMMKIARDCKADIGIKLKPPTKEKEDLKRFDILRGELSAGNSAVIPELKQYLFKFGKEGRISKRDMFDVLLEISTLA